MLLKAPNEVCVTASEPRLMLLSWLMHPYPGELLRGRYKSQDFSLGLIGTAFYEEIGLM